MVIVTQNQYILAQKINHITMDENIDHQEVRSNNGRYRTITDRYYQITVIYTPESSQASNSNQLSRDPELRECSVILRGAMNAHLAFKDLIRQIREQMPDQLYLDTALERMIADADTESLKDKDLSEKQEYEQEKKYDRRAKTVRGTRKAKRTSKAVLRKSKKRR